MSASIRVALNSLITQLKACISISGRVSAKKDEERQRERERERKKETGVSQKQTCETMPYHFNYYLVFGIFHA